MSPRRSAAGFEQPLEPSRDAPLRVVLVPTRTGCALLISLLHVAVDGGGTMAVAQSLAAHLTGTPTAAPVEARRSLRLAFERVRWFHAPVLALTWVGEAWRMLRLLAVPPRTRPFATEPGAPATWCRVHLDPARTARLDAACKAKAASINDGLLLALSRVSARYSAEGGIWTAFTIDLRRYLAHSSTGCLQPLCDLDGVPATNRVGRSAVRPIRPPCPPTVSRTSPPRRGPNGTSCSACPTSCSSSRRSRCCHTASCGGWQAPSSGSPSYIH